MHVLILGEALPQVQVLQNARGAGGRAVGAVLACLHGSNELMTGSANAAGGLLLMKDCYAQFMWVCLLLHSSTIYDKYCESQAIQC